MNLNERICGLAYFAVTGIVGGMAHLTAALASVLCRGVWGNVERDADSSSIVAI